MNYQDYIRPELLVLVPVLYLIGVGLKKSRLPDRFIPLALGGISILMTALWIFPTSDIGSAGDVFTAIFTSVTQGVLAAGASVYVSQIQIQAAKKDKSENSLNSDDESSAGK